MPQNLRAKHADAKVVGMRVAQRWLDHHGPQARAWLDQAPDIARSWAQRWGFAVGTPIAGGSVSIVLSVEREDDPAVLKLAAPWSRWPGQEAVALRAWGGHGAIRLLAASDDGRALLLERVWPGSPAVGMTATDMATLLGMLSRPAVPPGMPALAAALRVPTQRPSQPRHPRNH